MHISNFLKLKRKTRSETARIEDAALPEPTAPHNDEDIMRISSTEYEGTAAAPGSRVATTRKGKEAETSHNGAVEPRGDLAESSTQGSLESITSEFAPRMVEADSSVIEESQRAPGPPLIAEIGEVPLQAGDRIIMVMGGTGVGKSTFINLASGGNLAVGHRLKSHTATIQGALFEIDGARVCLIDTPGFNDLTHSDTEILATIVNCLVFLHATRNLQITAILYLHRITDNRVGGATRNNLELCSKLCGDGALRNMIMCTTMWNTLSIDTKAKQQREHELKEEFWAPMLDKGAVATRHDGTVGLARDIIRAALRFKPTTLSIQHEILVEEKKLEATAAGAHIRRALTALEERYRTDLEEAKIEWAKAVEEKDAVLQRALESDRRQYTEQIQRIQRDTDALMQAQWQGDEWIDLVGDTIWDFIKRLFGRPGSL
ncbi:hypothetical protein BOTBODRAFT_42334 [Botryobasidium botryosum FD-172 SS1]|uniref:AIG1-type G domain-containing protein n=1 Tax=Botryobasidium botryosum (strain FD-172 SS1) TaxID=930990 RepID=A0A067MVL8_BOTB1|nr:hypothetical protein BOTBODRAFT_42334 [Botryobasidium botryosum FD-172 SS1]